MNVIAVIVTYQPDLRMLREILRSLSAQCDVIIADNSPTPEREEAVVACLSADREGYIPMHGNRGIGAAQNRGVALAWEKGADAVLLLDDDSIPPADLVERLVACADAAGNGVVISANAVDSEGREISNARHIPGNLPECRDMMSSGTLISREIFERVGPFDESLFVDGVDFDWGWRARQKGFAIYLCRATAIEHRLGEGGRVAGVGLSSPVRHYFQYRNVLRLMGRSYTPWSWRLSQMAKLPTKLFVIALFMPQKAKRLGFVWAGVRDALLGRTGPLPASQPAVVPQPASK